VLEWIVKCQTTWEDINNQYIQAHIFISPNWELEFYDALPSHLLDPSWVQVNQTTEMFGTPGMLPTSSAKRGKGAC
jgi:hypothetical protein